MNENSSHPPGLDSSVTCDTPLFPGASNDSTTRADAIFVWSAVAILGVSGVLLNAALLFTLLHLNQRRRQPSHVALANLCVVDICACVLYLPLLAASVTSCGDVCGWLVPIERGLVAAFMWAITFVSMDRYLFIVRHASYRRKMTPKRAAFGVVFTWVTGLVFAGVSAVLSTHHIDYSGRCLCHISRHFYGFYSLGYTAFYIVACFVVPTIFTMVFYGFVIRKARDHVSHRPGRKPEPRPTSADSACTISVPSVKVYQIKTAKILFLLLGAYFVFVVPYFVVNLVLVTTSWMTSGDHLSVAYASSSVLLFASCVFNPVGYGFSNPRYRNSLLSFLRGRWRRRAINSELAAVTRRRRNGTCSRLHVMADESSYLSTSSGSGSVTSEGSGETFISRNLLSLYSDNTSNVGVAQSVATSLSVPSTQAAGQFRLLESLPGTSTSFALDDPTVVIRQPLMTCSQGAAEQTNTAAAPSTLVEVSGDSGDYL